MAVIQISKIQQRRGQKLLNGMPTLSSAEIGWAVDTQELFIGNGSVAEGAPYVGNTRILTEHDNILALISGYRFGADDPTVIQNSQTRSIQSKFDEEVSILDFMGIDRPDSSTTDCTIFFENAFADLFLNGDPSNYRYKKVLKIPNGIYFFAGSLKIPSYVRIEGETRDGVILDVSSGGIEFVSANLTDRFNFTTDDYPVDTSVSNLSIFYGYSGSAPSSTTYITGLKDSVFDNVRFLSEYQLGENVSVAVLPAQTYELTGIEADWDVRVSGIGVDTVTSVNFASNTVATINSLVTSLNLDPVFNSNFNASRDAESLVITLDDNSTLGLSASEIASYFTVEIINPFDVATTITPAPTEASTGIDNTVAALTWENTLFATRTNNILFKNCKFEKLPLGIKCIHSGGSSGFESEITFKDCEWYQSDTGIYIEGVSANQINKWYIVDSKFNRVAKQAVYSIIGTGIVIHRTEFKNCGNGTSGPANPETPIVEFGSKNGNIVVECISDRHQNGGLTTIATLGISEVVNANVVSFVNSYYTTDIEKSDSFTPLAVFSPETRYIEIDYVLTLNITDVDDTPGYVRRGKLTIVIDNTPDELAIADNFTYSSPFYNDRDVRYRGGTMMTNFEFNADLVSNTTTDDSAGGANIDTIMLYYKNPLSSGTRGKISYTLKYGV